MSTTTRSTVVTSTSTPNRPTLWPAALGAALAAAVATTTVAAVAHAAGISLDLGGDPIPLLAFAQVTLMFALVGLAIAAGLRRWANDPRRAWVRTTGVLVLLSFIPDVMADAAVQTKLVLMLTHLVAASIVIPAVASRLARR
jgi:purine-cytosine permease-like protein